MWEGSSYKRGQWEPGKAKRIQASPYHAGCKRDENQHGSHPQPVHQLA